MDKSVNKVVELYFKGYTVKQALEIVKEKVSKKELCIHGDKF
ncbi:hypothetical protein [Clostridium sp. DJ247]|nr:hypothetical protein [Clostridium sp. DJ247]